MGNALQTSLEQHVWESLDQAYNGETLLDSISRLDQDIEIPSHGDLEYSSLSQSVAIRRNELVRNITSGISSVIAN